MATPIENAHFLAALFQPASDAIGGLNATKVKVAQMGYQERLRQLKRQQDLEDATREFNQRTALTNLTIAGQERISDQTNARYITAEDKRTDRANLQEKERTDRALALAKEMEDRAEAKSVRDQLAVATAQYRVLAGANAKKPAEFGKTEREQLDGINAELAVLHDNTSKSRAKIALRAQRDYTDELERISTITPKDEPILLANAIGAISDKDALAAVNKLKGAKGAQDILTILTAINPQAAAEFAAGYEVARDGIIASRTKTSKLPSLQKNLDVHFDFLKRDPKAAEYVALGMVEEVPAENPAVPAVLSVDEAMEVGRRPKPNTPAAPSAVAPVITAEPFTYETPFLDRATARANARDSSVYERSPLAQPLSVGQDAFYNLFRGLQRQPAAPFRNLYSGDAASTLRAQ